MIYYFLYFFGRVKCLKTDLLVWLNPNKSNWRSAVILPISFLWIIISTNQLRQNQNNLSCLFFNVWMNWKFRMCTIHRPGAGVTNKFQHSITMLLWNKAVWLDVWSRVTIFNQFGCGVFETFVFAFYYQQILPFLACLVSNLKLFSVL